MSPTPAQPTAEGIHGHGAHPPVVPASASEAAAHGYQNLPPEEAAKLVQGQQFTFLDVRTPEEHAEGSAPGAINVPLLFKGPDGTPSVPNPNFVEQVKAAIPDTTAGVVCSCQHGRRGENATRQLAAAGLFDSLANVVGGLHAWGQAGLPVTQEEQGKKE